MASHYLKGLIKKRENDFLHRQRVTGQGGTVLNEKMGDLGVGWRLLPVKVVRH